MYGDYPRKLYHAFPLWALWFLQSFTILGNILVLMLLMIQETGGGRTVAATHALALALELFTFISGPLEMVLWTYHLLEPSIYLSSQIIKVLLYTAMAPISLWQLQAYFAHPDYVYWLLTSHFATTPIPFWLGLAYAVIIFVRSRRKAGHVDAPEDTQKISEI